MPSIEELRAECQAVEEEVASLQREQAARQEGVQELQQELRFLTKVTSSSGAAPNISLPVERLLPTRCPQDPLARAAPPR